MKGSVISLVPLAPRDAEAIRALAPGMRLVEAPGWFDGEMRDTWPAFTGQRYLRPDAAGHGTRAQRDALLADAEVILVGFPFPLDLRARAPGLTWVHQRPAGSSNMRAGDLWDSDVTVTSSRGYAHNLPIAEYVLAGILHRAKGLHIAPSERADGAFRAPAYPGWQIAGKTVCVVGAGGIGREVGRLCAAVGMTVTGVKRRPGPPGHGFREVCGPEDLHRLLGEADVVAICCQWTPQTHRLIGRDALAAMKPGALLINVARGEIIDEDALCAALATDRLGGVVLDVYDGEFERPPDPRLWSDDRVLITPHISAKSDVNSHGGTALFLANLRRYIAGEPLENVISWDLGY